MKLIYMQVANPKGQTSTSDSYKANKLEPGQKTSIDIEDNNNTE